MKNSPENIENRIKELEEELKLLKSQLPVSPTVSVPGNVKPIFDNAQQTVNEYFKNLEIRPEKGTIEIKDQRYILIRASALSDEFFTNIQELYKEKSSEEAFKIASNFLFDFAHLIGKQDAKRFHEEMELKEPIEKLAAGPIHFAHTGWAFVDILPESNPVPNENFFLKYHHPYSFEADSWIRSNKIASKPVCVMNAAYSSGWCSESFDLPLTAVEITCRAKGDENCTFIMAPPSKMDEILDQELRKKEIIVKPQVPYFFKRKELEEKLIKNEKLLKNAQKISKLGSWEFNLETNELIWSDELYKIYELDANEIESKNLYAKYLTFFSSDELLELNKCVELAINKGIEYSITHKILLPNNKIKWIQGSGVPIKDENGKIVKLSGYAQDISERINNEVQLNKFFELSNDMLCLANFEGYFLKLSKGWELILGYSYEELTSNPFMTFIHQEDIEKTIKEYVHLKDGDYSLGFENRYKCKDDTYKIMNWNCSPDQKTGLIYCIVRDVTEERVAESVLKDTLNEKEILLKEVHHRVKNNLQIISSLLNLQGSYLNNKVLSDSFNESQNRIKSIASIHELLYQSSDLGSIYFNDYLRKLCSDLIYSYYGTNGNVKFELDAPYKFNIDTSIPLGLLLNEIVSNSLKHGLKNEPSDLITITITKLKDQEMFELNIMDNGIGFDFEKEFTKNDSLGLMLIHELSSQLNGEIEKVLNTEGTAYRLFFKEN